MENISKANYGTALVTQALTRLGCLVRPVAEGTDIGIDLFCESVVGENPFLHFWIQVKCGKIILGADGQASYVFKGQHLRYWAKQPVPVFALLVPLEAWPPTSNNNYPIYLVDITFKVITGTLNLSQENLTLYSDLTINGDDDLSILLHDFLPKTTSIQSLREGYVKEIPLPTGPNYELFIPLGQINKYLKTILIKVRRAVAMAVAEAEQFKDNVGLTDSQKTIIADILRSFVNEGYRNWETNFALGYIAYLNADYPTALKEFKEARTIIEDDAGLNDARWIEHKESCNRYISEINMKL